MTKPLFIQYFGNSPQLGIIDFFLDNESKHSKKEVIRNTRISKTTFYTVWPLLENFGIFSSTWKYGNVQLHSLNRKNAIVKQFMSLDSALGKQAMQKFNDENIKPELKIDNQI